MHSDKSFSVSFFWEKLCWKVVVWVSDPPSQLTLARLSFFRNFFFFYCASTCSYSICFWYRWNNCISRISGRFDSSSYSVEQKVIRFGKKANNKKLLFFLQQLNVWRYFQFGHHSVSAFLGNRGFNSFIEMANISSWVWSQSWKIALFLICNSSKPIRVFISLFPFQIGWRCQLWKFIITGFGFWQRM